MKALVLSTCIAVLISSPTVSAPHCGPHDEIVQGLFDRYGETVRLTLLNHDNQTIEILLSEYEDTWTILTSTPSETCVAYYGKGPLVWPAESI